MTKILKKERTCKRLSGVGGLFLYNRLWKQLYMEKGLINCLPVNKIKPKVTALEKTKAMVMGLISGADCLDDMDDLFLDLGFDNVVSASASNTYGEFLRSFSNLDTKKLNHSLVDTALKLRKRSHRDVREFILDIDSTSHEQHGSKIEGASWNYKNEWCLDSLLAFDQFGYLYWLDVRNGSTYSANSCSEVVHAVFSKILDKRIKRYTRADSAFCNGEFFQACFNARTNFVVRMKENMLSTVINKVSNWRRTKLTMYDNRECEIGDTLYYPNSTPSVLKVVVIRALKNEKQGALFTDDKYEYFAVVTNIPEQVMKNESVIEFYRKRGNAENYIKELKYGFDLKHFPCQKLTANKVYGTFAAIAYNMMRYTAFLTKLKKVSFSKKLRLQLVKLPCEVITHAGYVTFRYTNHIYEEVSRLLQITNMQFQSGL